jgi:pyruvate/2-oxoglutarate dehydrogenase complex dihydrolipoamide acyltransferase (E2) component
MTTIPSDYQMPETTETSVAAAPVAAAPEPAAPAPAASGFNPGRTVDDVHIPVPSARHLVGSKGFDATGLTGSGKSCEVTKGDVSI